MGSVHDCRGLVSMLMHCKTWLISVKDIDMCFQTTVPIEFAYGKRKRFNVSAHLKELTNFVGPGALPPRHGMIRAANMLNQILTYLQVLQATPH
jgi:hypothetical protein